MKILNDRAIQDETLEESRASLMSQLHLACYWLRTTNKKMYEFTIHDKLNVVDIFKFLKKDQGAYFYKVPQTDKWNKKLKQIQHKQYVLTLNKKGKHYWKRHYKISNNTTNRFWYTLLLGLHFGYSLNKVLKFSWKYR